MLNRSYVWTGQGEVAIPKLTNAIRDISISQLDRGYIVRVGCQSFAIETTAVLIAKLSEYISNPDSTEQKWLETKSF